ncbi:TolC family protein [candidate division KSB1 bacterium]|nr:TolC family protein [candidate division KSB1 bacterium]
MKQKLLTTLCILFICSTARADILDSYIAQGLSNNLALKQKSISLEQSIQALHQARGMFLPSVSLDARYSRAGGGRMIEIPIGDLMNPVYSTLNQLLTQVGQPALFPENLQNQSVPFLREKEQDTKIRVVQPLFQPAIYRNYKIRSDQRGMQEAEVGIFKRQLISDIHEAYFNYLKTVRVVALLDQTNNLLKENVRVSESLFRNQKITEEGVFSARAELSALEQQRADAQKSQTMAAAYFNFLLNRPLDVSIDILDVEADNAFKLIPLADALALARSHREEFQLVNHGIDAAYHGVRLAGSSFLPGVTGVFDYGYQGEKYKFTPDDDYWMASVVLNWNFFNGFQDKAKRNQAVLEKTKLETQLMELENQIQLQVKEAHENVRVAQLAIASTRDRVTSARKSFQLTQKKYTLGMVPPIEYRNARHDLTEAELQAIIAVYDYHIQAARFERVIAK